MATTSTPYGLKPINEIGGLPYAGSTRKLPITSGFGTNLFYGAVVCIAANGTIELVITNGDNSTPFPAGTIGVFMGCSYTDSTMGFVNRQYWPSGTVASDALAFIVDDPNTLFQAQAAGTVTQTDLGQNTHFDAVQSTSTGSTATGNSNTALDATTGATSGWAFRIVDFVDAPGSEVGDAYTDLIVKFNPDSHSYTNKTGI
jgi:hypothetical protein|tara:strand:- start:1079 stop:1681 length:603 start_codon:yes stop_codon:yes gene_type:complete